VPEATSPPI